MKPWPRLDFSVAARCFAQCVWQPTHDATSGSIRRQYVEQPIGEVRAVQRPVKAGVQAM